MTLFLHFPFALQNPSITLITFRSISRRTSTGLMTHCFQKCGVPRPCYDFVSTRNHRNERERHELKNRKIFSHPQPLHRDRQTARRRALYTEIRADRVSWCFLQLDRLEQPALHSNRGLRTYGTGRCPYRSAISNTSLAKSHRGGGDAASRRSAKSGWLSGRLITTPLRLDCTSLAALQKRQVWQVLGTSGGL